MHIGLIGGIGVAATDYYYRGLIELHADSGHALDLTIAHADARQLVDNLANNAAQKQADVFCALLRRLEAAGARVGVVPSMGGHFCMRALEPRSPLPLINLLPELNAAIAARKLRAVGLIGTRMVMETKAYGAISAAAVLLPEGNALEEVHRAYVEMAVAGRVSEDERQVFFAAGRELCRLGAQAVVLGGTDLFLAFEGRDCGFATIDCAAIHIEAIYRASIGAT